MPEEIKSICHDADLIFVRVEKDSVLSYLEFEVVKCSKCEREMKIPLWNSIKKLRENIRSL